MVRLYYTVIRLVDCMSVRLFMPGILVQYLAKLGIVVYTPPNCNVQSV